MNTATTPNQFQFTSSDGLRIACARWDSRGPSRGIVQIAHAPGGITLAIALLVPRTTPPWQIPFHRFTEVSIGIAVALLGSVVWPESEDAPAGNQLTTLSVGHPASGAR